MAKVRVRIELNKGRRGIPLGKLSKISEETLKFLSMVYRDAALPGDPDGWLALNFENNSVDFDCECLEDIESSEVRRTYRILRAIMTNDRSSEQLRSVVRDSTRRQYSQIAGAIGPDEAITFKLFSNGDVEPHETHALTKTTAYEIELELPTGTTYRGEIQGTIHSLFKEEKPRRIRLRESSTGKLVDCQFDEELYRNLIEVLTEPRGIVFVEGEIHENLVTETIDLVEGKAFRLAPMFDEDRFRSLIGCAPNLTGNLTTEEFVDRLRNGGDS